MTSINNSLYTNGANFQQPGVTTGENVNGSSFSPRTQEYQVNMGNQQGQGGSTMDQVTQMFAAVMEALTQILSQLMQLLGGGQAGQAGSATGETSTGGSAAGGATGGAGSTGGSSTAGSAGSSGASGSTGTENSSGTGQTDGIIPNKDLPGSNGTSGTSTDKKVGAEEVKPAVQSPLEALVDDKGAINVLTEDGYRITCEGKDMAWDITSPDGKTTRIWGDPHVKESDGDAWDFLNQSSFQFGNTKVTVETVPAGNGQTFSSKLHIYNGNERITIGGIDTNSPRILADADDARTQDAAVSDGDTYVLGKETGTGEDQWTKQ